MSVSSDAPTSRRERNKQEKRERIIAAASSLFAARGIDEVTTQEIADAADIGTGTLFLYARSKGELLLLVQNAHYARALERGRSSAATAETPFASVMAYLRPIVECNRTHVENGRTYLREMVFGDPTEHHHAVALGIAAETERSIAAALVERGAFEQGAASATARIISSVMFLTLGASANVERSVDELVDDIGSQVAVLLVDA